MGRHLSAETRHRMHLAALKRPASHNQKISDALRGRPLSPEHIEAARQTKLAKGTWKPLGHTYVRTRRGYSYRWVKVAMGKGRQNYKAEHRLVIESQIGRELLSHEHVHHLNGDTLDNRPENLAVVSKSDHALILKLLHCMDESLARVIVQTLTERFPNLDL